MARGPRYRALFPTIGGLRPGDQVRYGGLAVGRVKHVRIDPADPGRLEVVFTVRDDTPMRDDMRASILDATNPVTRYLMLRPGTAAADRLRPGSVVRTEVGPTLEETLTRATRVLQRADTILAAVDRLTRGDFFARINRVVGRADELTLAASRGAERWGPSVERTLLRLDSVTAHTNALLATLDSAGPQLRAASVEAAGLLQEARAGAARGGGVGALMADLTTASDHLARLTARLERDPTTLIRSRGAPEKRAGPEIR
jgi:phospholipid/cholesterol/gamma-HCH transport system substrate-binding protein